MTDAPANLSPDQLSANLNLEIAKYTSKGYVIETMTPMLAVLVKQRKMGIFWNIVLTLITGGLWLIVVVIRMFNKKADRVTLVVDPRTGGVTKR